MGEVRQSILPIFIGQGSNGKTVLLETVREVLGDYATVAPQKFLVQGPPQHATEIAALAGARLVIASETNEGERFDGPAPADKNEEEQQRRTDQCCIGRSFCILFRFEIIFHWEKFVYEFTLICDNDANTMLIA